jgi:hypothetical protein
VFNPFAPTRAPKVKRRKGGTLGPVYPGFGPVHVDPVDVKLPLSLGQ